MADCRESTRVLVSSGLQRGRDLESSFIAAARARSPSSAATQLGLAGIPSRGARRGRAPQYSTAGSGPADLLGGSRPQGRGGAPRGVRRICASSPRPRPCSTSKGSRCLTSPANCGVWHLRWSRRLRQHRPTTNSLSPTWGPCRARHVAQRAFVAVALVFGLLVVAVIVGLTLTEKTTTRQQPLRRRSSLPATPTTAAPSWARTVRHSGRRRTRTPKEGPSRPMTSPRCRTTSP